MNPLLLPWTWSPDNSWLSGYRKLLEIWCSSLWQIIKQTGLSLSCWQKASNERSKPAPESIYYLNIIGINLRMKCSRKIAAAAMSLQLCPTLCDPIDGSPPGSPIPGILQAKTLEWVTISFSNAWKWKVKVKSLSCIQLLATPWTAAYQAPPPMGFSRQEYWSGLPLPSPMLGTRVIQLNSSTIHCEFRKQWIQHLLIWI